MSNFRHVAPVAFPSFQPRNINMMPFIMGDASSIPADLHDYLPMIDACPIGDEAGKVGYLTIDERFVERGTHRRAGVHTEGFGSMSWGAWGKGTEPKGDWGGGGWGGQKGGLYIANSIDDSCILFDAKVLDTPFGGAVSDEQLVGVSHTTMPANNVFWLHDRTPHASLPCSGERQFFRLVTSEVSLWFAKHSTPNPLGVQPTARIVDQDKFEMLRAAA
ncbi:MAG: hypothetical protein DI537_41105 [Stutzerimonas stutzeri]|nr:MAG: hypothetical protein DI537_41105 [Stutzerimonas stutzeri]